MTEEATHDLVVVGAGPCGLSAAVAARNEDLSCAIFDKGSLARSISLYPTYGTFFSTADRLEIGDVPFIVAGDRPSRLEALKYYRRVAEEFDLAVHQYTEVTGLTGQRGDFTVHTRSMAGEERRYRARNVVVATGYADSPNYIGVPGEDLPKVTHYFTEGHPYYDQDCVVVGAGNSAVEAALDLYRAGARVTLVHFLDELDSGVKPWILPDIQNRLERGEIGARWKTRIVEILPDRVRLRHEETGAVDEIRNDFVIAMTGYCPDTGLLEGVGVRVDGATGIPEHDPESMETNALGVYIAGVLAGGNRPDKIFIETGRHHGPAAVRHMRETATRRDGSAASVAG